MENKKYIIIAIVFLLLAIGGIATVKGLQIKSMIAFSKEAVPPPETVTIAPARLYDWESLLTAVGSLDAVQGVVITSEVSGRVTRIAFESGVRASAGQLLVQQDISTELADKTVAESSLELADKEYKRARELLPHNAISKSDLDARKADYDRAVARLDSIRTLISKKTIRAPFNGYLGIRRVDTGEILKANQEIVSLQSLDPIYVNFQLPQQYIGNLEKGLSVRIENDAIEGKHFSGTITAVNSEVDKSTRNIMVQATIENPDRLLKPGMYVDVTVVLPSKEHVLAIPATAVQYAPYGDSVFIVEEKADEGSPGKTEKVIRQQFVQLGEKRGDFIAVVSGLKEGDTVVSTGVFKLRSGQQVTVDNTYSPEFKLDPTPEDA